MYKHVDFIVFTFVYISDLNKLINSIAKLYFEQCHDADDIIFINIQKRTFCQCMQHCS
jgi:hypothetical protein